MKRVVVGLSGGVDSSVAAYLLQQEGYEVIGLFMKNWHDTSVTISTECPWLEDSNDAMLVAQKLGIPFQVVDMSEPYKERVVDYMFAEYKAGRTPNPDVLCNREIKFDVFLKTALELGADYVATGHYARVDSIRKDQQTFYRLLAGKDQNKDQSYFLCQLTQEQLSKSLFPIGELEKAEVRAIAHQLDLVTADKKDSQGLCFVGKVHLPDFLQQQLAPKEGQIITIPSDSPIYKEHDTTNASVDELAKKYHYQPTDGKVVSTHQGAHFFTIGQRKGLAVGGTKEPLYVIATDVTDNIVYVGEGKNHPGLYRKALFIQESDLHHVRPDLALKAGETLDVMARIRYRQPLQKARLQKTDSGLYIIFDQPQSAITAGQFAAWYLDDELVGSGVID
ncbi:MAG: tRNA 2-thiouridine(34) synthase MnmA [Flavobacteriales bacterium]|nr:MAG: tRNA 2-thiouridine(34) synthase MnmA [Flavobacteriales bacterium]